ncbi:hypothetical protein EV137_1896 [Kribbella pratensis]|uniref:Lipoprotein n=1 Tax=Kribbella pratensis TaxID=2512112 RepID=A0ABY2FN50_9ACTN|nr:hypothetical protein [Kribbella pratensis]TDW94579.1 hypothetical protein EV137_1896 [Kribbella pratensis]
MPRRPLLAAVATLSTLTLLTACNGSPEAGRPNTTPTTTSPTPTPSSTPAGPRWTPAEQTAIAAAKKQYVLARAAIDTALASPAKADQGKLASAGNGGAWMTTVLEDIATFQEYGWYESGRTKITTVHVSSVKLDLEQPEVRLINCIDSSAVVIRSQADNKPVSAGTGTKKPKKVSSSVVYAPSAADGGKRWRLVAEQELGAC